MRYLNDLAGEYQVLLLTRHGRERDLARRLGANVGQANRRRATGSHTVREVPRINPHRDVMRAWQRYLRMEKTDRLLDVEQAYSEMRERWLRLNDELLALALQQGIHSVNGWR